jgi:uncharacterized membrane protein YfcA
MRDRAVVWAVALSLVVTAGLAVRVIAIGKPAVLVILVPAFLGALLAVWRRRRLDLTLAAVLIALTAIVSLIGGEGLLYVPSIVLLVRAALIPSERPAVTR